MKYLIPFALLCLIFSYSCSPEFDIDTSSDVKLTFSKDTLHFDTVFTELGSATRILKVYNNQKKAIKISKVSIENDPNSFFRINVDGISSNEVTDVEIAGKDSLYIFAEVTIDPDQPLSNSPFVIEDYLVFEINGNTQKVLMEAWGQNAIYFPDRFSKAEQTNLDCGGGNFVITNDKPWVFYGTVVFYNCNVIVEAGSRIHVHGGIVRGFDQDSMSFFFNDGRVVMATETTLNINGTLDEPVIISGDRLEDSFEDIPGQWWGLYLFDKSKNHKIEYAEIKNSIVGIVVDSAVDLTIQNSKIYNTANAGLIGVHSEIDATNCLFYNNGGNAVRVLQGGKYNFTYCTLASYGVDASALYMSNVICLDPLTCNPCRENKLEANFKNSIIFGSRRDEIDLLNLDECDPGRSSPLNYSFQNCIVRVDELVDGEKYQDFFDRCDPCQNGDSNSVLFKDPNEGDYHLDTLSIAEGKAMPLIIDIDLDGVQRDASMPDEGCYEFVPQ